MTRRPLWLLLALFSLLLIAAVLRAFLNDSGVDGVTFHRHDESHYVGPVLGFLNGDWQVDDFINPSFQRLLLYVATLVSGASLTLAGQFESFQAFIQAARLDPYQVTLVGRVLAMLLGLASVGLLFRIGQRMFGSVVGLLAAAALATSTTHAERCVLAGNESSMLFLLLLFFLALLRYLDRPSAARHIVAGGLLGLATATKYNAGIFVLTLLAGTWIAHRSDSGRRLLRPGNLAGFAALVVGFLLGSPWILLHFGEFLSDFRTQSAYLHEGFMEYQAEAGRSGFLEYPLAFARIEAGWPMAILCAAGLARASYRATLRGESRLWLVLLATLPLYLFLGTGIFSRLRFLLPALPFLYLAGAWALEGLVHTGIRWLARARPQRPDPLAAAATLSLGLLLLLPQAAGTHAAMSQRYGSIDSRRDLYLWVTKHQQDDEVLVWFDPFNLKVVPRDVSRPSLIPMLGEARDLSELRAALRRSGARSLVIVLKQIRPEMLFRLPDLVHPIEVRGCPYWDDFVRLLMSLDQEALVPSHDGRLVLTRLRLPGP